MVVTAQSEKNSYKTLLTKPTGVLKNSLIMGNQFQSFVNNEKS